MAELLYLVTVLPSLFDVRVRASYCYCELYAWSAFPVSNQRGTPHSPFQERALIRLHSLARNDKGTSSHFYVLERKGPPKHFKHSLLQRLEFWQLKTVYGPYMTDAPTFMECTPTSWSYSTIQLNTNLGSSSRNSRRSTTSYIAHLSCKL